MILSKVIGGEFKMPKLNYDCIRDILLTIQDLDFDSSFECHEHHAHDRLNGYSKSEFNYHVIKLYNEQFIDAHIVRGDGFEEPLFIKDLSWKGHDFLQALGNDTVYKKTKNKVLTTVGTVSLDIFKSLAVQTSKGILGLE